MEDEYQDQLDDYEDSQEASQDLQDSQLESYESYPQGAKPREDQYTWFWKIVKLGDSTKVANVEDKEIGPAPLTIRGIKRVALVAEQLGNSKLAEYFNKEAEIILATSMSRRGWLVEQSISQKKSTTRARVRQGGGQGWKIYQKKDKRGEDPIQ